MVARFLRHVKTRVPTKKRSGEQPTLFPGYLLHNKVRQVQFATTLVGEIFEKLSGEVAGKRWHRLIPETYDCDVRPDLGTDDGLNFIESKSCQHRLKVTTFQLKHYCNLVEDHAKLQQHCNVNYFFWHYGNRSEIKLVEPGRTIQSLIAEVTENVRHLHIVHWSIVAAMLEKLPKNVTFHSYDSWKICERIKRPFEVMQFGEPFLRRLRDNPVSLLRDELGLDPMCYDLETKHKRKRYAECVFDGMTFPTNSFWIHKYTPNEHYTPFPEVFMADRAAIPF